MSADHASPMEKRTATWLASVVFVDRCDLHRDIGRSTSSSDGVCEVREGLRSRRGAVVSRTRVVLDLLKSNYIRAVHDIHCVEE